MSELSGTGTVTADVKAKLDEAANMAAGDLLKATTCLQITLRTFGVRQKVDAAELGLGGDGDTARRGAREALHVSKDILESETLTAIRRADGDLRRYIIDRSLPTQMLKGGIYVLPLALVGEIDKRLDDFAERREFLIDTFLREYEKEDGLVAAAETRLGPLGLFDRKDYPAASRVRAAFGITTRYLQFEVPTSLKELSPELYKRELEKAREYGEQAVAEIRIGLRQQMKELTDAMVEKLVVDPISGKPKMFLKSGIERFEEFLSLFEFRNIAKDEVLAAQVERARRVIRGADIDALRKVGAERDFVTAQFAAIKQAVDALPMDEGEGRQFAWAKTEAPAEKAVA